MWRRSSGSPPSPHSASFSCTDEPGAHRRAGQRAGRGGPRHSRPAPSRVWFGGADGCGGAEAEARRGAALRALGKYGVQARSEDRSGGANQVRRSPLAVHGSIAGHRPRPVPARAKPLVPRNRRHHLRRGCSRRIGEVPEARRALGSVRRRPWRCAGRGGRTGDQGDGFNTHGVSVARVALEAHADGHSVIAGELWPRSGLRRFRLQAPLESQGPMQLVFDTWKAWPKPAAYTPSDAGTDVRIAPARTYPEVEKQVSAQVRQIAFFGARRIPGSDDLRAFASGLLRAGVTRTLAGGTLPDIFSTDRMDDRGSTRGPITIL